MRSISWPAAVRTDGGSGLGSVAGGGVTLRPVPPGGPVRDMSGHEQGDDERMMARAAALGWATRRRTAPWPAVGCVITAAGAIVGEGATGDYPTGPHAEPAALGVAGESARGATAYVTLEPCDHHGNTPPCTEALIAAGVTRVVIACTDPDERVAGRGVLRLREAGIEVVVGVGAESVTEDLAPYLHHRRTGRAFVTAKIAMSLDARVAAADGTSQWITGPVARADTHELRADVQAVVVGSGTALADRPALTVRGVAEPPREPPCRVLLDGRGRVPPAGPLFDDSAPTLVVTTAGVSAMAVNGWRRAGAEVVTVPAAPSGLDLDAVLTRLGEQGVLHALFEGGGNLLGSVVDAGRVDRLVAYVAPLVLGTGGRPAFGLRGPDTLAAACRYRLRAATVVGEDVRLDYARRAEED